MGLRFITIFAFMVSLLFAEAKAKDTTILLFGDSIIAGYGLKPEESIPTKLQIELQKKDASIRVINGGVSGDTTSAGRGRLKWTLDKYQPDAVLLALGGNDMLRGIRPSVTRENIHAMMKMLKERELKVILSAVEAPTNLGLIYQSKFNSIYTDAEEEYDVPLYPFLLTETFGKRALMLPDGIHPSAEGAKLIAQNLAVFLDNELKL